MSNYYINREISWLKFNRRVLDEANASTVPAYEKLRFLSIFTSNLDEFFMVRAGSLYDRSLLKDEMPDNKTGMTAKEQLDAIYREVRPLYTRRDQYYKSISQKLDQYGIHHLNMKELTPAQTKFIKQYFKREILPLVSPQIIDAKHPFPHLENKRLYILVSLKNDGKSSFGIIPLTNIFRRVTYLPTGNNEVVYLLTEEILLRYVAEIFKMYQVQSRAVIRITRNADVEVEDNFSDDDIDYRDYVKEIIKKREKLAPVRMETYLLPESKVIKLGKYGMERLGLHDHQCFVSETPLDMSYVGELEEKIHNKEVFYQPLLPQNLSFANPRNRITEQVEKKDVFLSYPYYSMKPYLMLLKEASEDKETLSIKITLYRLSSNSEIISTLCQAAENGKEVTAIVELKARFDETNNINWSRRLEEAGCHVIYGIDTLKVHSKITLFTRRSGETIKYIAHIGTGNYNEKTAKLYTDVGIITSNVDLCADAVTFFQNITLGITQNEYRSLFVAPNGLKSGILAEIQKEVVRQKEGKTGYIRLKMNSMTDKEIIDALVAASQTGVKVDLIIRGICCLQPGIPEVTDRIRVVSIVGRYLEHSRIFIFGTEEDRRVYIGSADLMTRNTSRRVEIIAPIYEKAIAAQLWDMTEVMLKDTVKASYLCSNGEYEHVLSENPPLDSQLWFYEKAYEKHEE